MVQNGGDGEGGGGGVDGIVDMTGAKPVRRGGRKGISESEQRPESKKDANVAKSQGQS